MEVIVRELDHGSSGCHDSVYQFHEIEDMVKSLELGGKICDISFVTGNKNKVIELKQTLNLKNVRFTILDVDLPEIQDSNVLNIVQDKCERAFRHINKLSTSPGDVSNDGGHKGIGDGSIGLAQREAGQGNNRAILVEDTCLNFRALKGMPGPYIKWFMKAVGCEGLHRMLAGFEDKSAEAVCIYAFMDSSKRIIFFRGSVRGQITKPRGSSWGWDPVFEEERSRLTFGEMEASMKSKFSHRANAITALRKYLTVAA